MSREIVLNSFLRIFVFSGNLVEPPYWFLKWIFLHDNVPLFQDGSGAIDKDELRELFMDMFPTFNK